MLITSKTLAGTVALFLLILASNFSCAAKPSGGIRFEQEPDRISVYTDGKLFTRYLICSGTKPVLWPLMGPTDKPMTRGFPITKTNADEATDHIHHRSLWVGYEGLNGVDFWHEPATTPSRPSKNGKTLHKKFEAIKADGRTGKIVALNDWLDAEEKRVCSDRRTLIFGFDEHQRWIDIQLELIASEGPLNIGDSKEGFLAVRVASTLKIDANMGGNIVNSRGEKGKNAWSRHAEWVDYHGPIDDVISGIAILSHPSSSVPLPRWHVRSYGLFAANPFGEIAFTDQKTKMSKRPLRHNIPAGESIFFRYRIIFHLGDEKDAMIAEQFADYAKQ